MSFINDTDKLDQHFLIDNNVFNEFIKAMDLNKNDIVVEVGPGKGILTEIIASKVKYVTAIELDNRLEKLLNIIKSKYNNINILYGNVLNIYIPKCNKIITSLPYSITEPFIEKLLRCEFDEVIMITGNNFADNVVNNNITKLSLLTNCFFKTEKILEILPDSFNPKPRTLSALIKIKKINKNDLVNSRTMFIFREMFFHRNKKIKNNIIDSIINYNELLNNKITQKESKLLLDKMNLSEIILQKKIENCNNDEIKQIYNKIDSI